MTPAAAPTPSQVRAAIFAGCAVAFLSLGFTVAFGMFIPVMSAELGWGREVFSLSVALQLLFWGLSQPIAGAVADRYGTARVLAFGALVAGLGYVLRGVAGDPTAFVLTGVVVGIGTGASSFPVVITALGKVVPAARRSLVMGLGTAAASVGIVVAAPMITGLIGRVGWQATLFVIAGCYVLVLPCLIFIARVSVPSAAGAAGGAFGRALRLAFGDVSYVCLFLGFFVCGFHVAFIQTHLPAYITDAGLAASLGATSIALIGLFNIGGSLAAGWSGQVFSKKRVLAGIYAARAAVIFGFLMVPLSAASILVFSALMGVLWLSTVPLTTGLVAQTQGLTFLSTLAGLVFLSHQVGSFLGAWLGGRLYDLTGGYSAMWWAAIALGLAAALIHLPIRESPGPLARAEGV